MYPIRMIIIPLHKLRFKKLENDCAHRASAVESLIRHIFHRSHLRDTKYLIANFVNNTMLGCTLIPSPHAPVDMDHAFLKNLSTDAFTFQDQDESYTEIHDIPSFIIGSSNRTRF